MSSEYGSHRKPSHRLYTVIGEGDDAVWRPIGAAWPNRDGKGFNIELDAVPLSGRLAMRVPKARTDGRDD